MIVFWQFILKVIDELTIVANPILSLEMLIMRLIHLKDMPDYESLLNALNKNDDGQKEENTINQHDKKKFLNEEKKINKISKDQIKNTTQTKPELTSLDPKSLMQDINLENISSFEDLIKLSSKKKEIELKYDLERNVNLVKFSEGKIDISFNEKLGKNFIRNLRNLKEL